jgi:hypothetical protein
VLDLINPVTGVAACATLNDANKESNKATLKAVEASLRMI